MGNLSEQIALNDALPNLFYSRETDVRTVKRKHLRDYIRFRDSTRILISIILKHPHKAASLDFGNLNWNNLRAFLDELDDDMRPALLAYGDGLLQTRYETCDLMGIATRMRAFVGMLRTSFS